MTDGRPTTASAVTGSDQEVLERAVEWLTRGRKVAIATVIGTWGSSPRRPGSQMAVSDRRDICGSVSGGCVEGAVVEEAQEVLQSGDARVLEYGVSDQEAWAVGLACGGRIRVYLEVGNGEVLQSILGGIVAERTPVLATNVSTGERRVLFPFGEDDPDGAEGPQEDSPELVDDEMARGVVGRGDLTVLERSDGPVFLRVYSPPLRLVIVGAVHIAQPLAGMARAAGLDVVVVDPRKAFATADRFPETRLVHRWPGEALEELNLDQRTAVVTLTHDPKLDDPGLLAALPSAAFYVGALGSRRTQARRVERLREAGLTATEVGRIHGPIGLDLGGETPSEIAVAILAEIIATRRGPSRRGPE